MNRADLFRALETLHTGVWLGLLDKQAFHQISNQQYQAWDSYQDRDYNLSGLQDWEEKAVERSFRDCRSVLLGAAGGGREIIALSRRQIQLDAFECCPRLGEVVNDCSKPKEFLPTLYIHSRTKYLKNLVSMTDSSWAGERILISNVKSFNSASLLGCLLAQPYSV